MEFVALGTFELIILLGFGGGLPLGIPPEPIDEVMVRIAPEECLFFATWAGVAEPDPQSPNQTEQLLAEPEVRHLIAQLHGTLTSGLNQVAAREGPQAQEALADVSRWAQTLLTHPATVFVSSLKIGPGGPEVRAGAMVKVGDQIGELKATLLKHQEKYAGDAARRVEIAGNTWYRIQPGRGAPAITWGTKGEYLVIGIGEEAVEEIFQRASTDPPEWLREAHRQLPVDRLATLAYFNVESVMNTLLPIAGGPRARQWIEAVGLGNVRWLASVTGLDKEGFVNRTLLAFDGEPGGIFAVVAGDPLGREDLAAIPRDATVAMAARLDTQRVLQTLLSVAGKFGPEARAEIDRRIGKIEEALDVDLSRDLLEPLGDVWQIYNSPGEGGLVFTGLTAVVGLDDPDRFAQTHGKLLALVRSELERGGRDRAPRIEEFQFAGHNIYFLNVRDHDFFAAPAWCLAGDKLIVAPFPQQIKAYLSRTDQFEPLAAGDALADLFQLDQGPVTLSYVDTRAVFDLVYPLAQGFLQAGLGELQRQGIDVNISILPSAAAIGKHLRPSVGALRRTDAGIELISRQTLPGGNLGTAAPMAVALLLPATQSARGAARRAQSTNNLKQIGLAIHNYHATYKHFPAAYTTDDEGKPLLSWRVQILPYLEAAPLYEQFHQDEPWDSEHNKSLIPLMPPALLAPGSSAGPGKTIYLAIRSEHSVMADGKPLSFSDMTDGTSNTIMTVEAADQSAVTWTRPDDFQPDPANPTKGLIGLRPRGFLAGFTDGSVRFISESIDGEMLNALFTRNGGEVVRDY